MFPTSLWVGNFAKNPWRQRVTVQCYPRSWPLSEIYLHNFVHGVKGFLHRLYNKSFFDCSLGNLLNFDSLKYQCLSRFRLGKHWDSRETKLTVFLGISHHVLITWFYRLRITSKTVSSVLSFRIYLIHTRSLQLVKSWTFPLFIYRLWKLKWRFFVMFSRSTSFPLQTVCWTTDLFLWTLLSALNTTFCSP